MAQKDKIKELVGRGLNSYHTKSLQQIDRIEKKNKEQNHKISILSNELDNDYLTKTEEGSVISLEHSKEGMVYLDELQGNTLVNYCTDGSKEMTLNGYIDVEGTFVTTTEGVDNGKVDVMCEGNTLVNNILNISANEATFTPSKRTFTIGKDGLIKGNTDYTVIFKISDINLDGLESVSIQIEMIGGFENHGRTIGIVDKNGIYKFKHTTSTRVGNGDIVIKGLKQEWEGSTSTTRTLKISEIMLLEGDWTNREVPVYFEGMKSVGELGDNKIEILSQNKNIFDEIWYSGTIDVNTGLEQNNGGECRSDYIVIKDFSELYIKEFSDVSIPYNHYKTRFYDINKKYIGVTDTWSRGNQYTIPNGAYYLRIVPYQTPKATMNNIKVVISNQEITEYTSSLFNKKEILINEPLRSLPNGVKDKFVKINNKFYIERNCGEVEVVSTMSIRIWGDVPNTINNAFIIQTGIKNKNTDLSSIVFNCDKHIPRTRNYLPNNDVVGICDSQTQGNILIKLPATNLTEYSIDAFRTWLSNNPFKVVYQLETPTYEPLEIEPVLNTYNDITHISNNSIVPCNMKIKNSGYNTIIKPSTLYTIALDTNKSGTIGINLGGAKATTTNNVATITTPATLTDDSLRIYGKGIKGSKVRLLEGDKTNWIPSHFEGIKSSFEDKFDATDNTYKMEILSNNKNLLDLNDLILTSYNDHTVEKITNGFKIKSGLNGQWGIMAEFKLRVKPNTRYTLGITKTVIKNAYEGKDNTSWDVGYTWIKTEDDTTITEFKLDDNLRNAKTFNTRNNTVIRIRFTTVTDKPTTIGEYDFTDISLVEDTVNSKHIPHKSNKIQFSSIEPLRGVNLRNGSYKKDRFVFIDNSLKIERNCKKIILDGSQDMVYNTNEDKNGTAMFSTRDITEKRPSYHVECDTFSSSGNNLMTTTNFADKEGIGAWSALVGFNIRIKTCKLNSVNAEGIKEYLRNNPATIIYPLSEPTYEEVPFELQKIILEGYENGTLFFDTNIPPTSTITYAGETPIVKATKLNKTEILNNTNDINDNIVPYLMDMDYRLVCIQLQSEEFNCGVSMARLFGGAYEMLQRDIQSRRYSVDEYRHRLDAYLGANKITEDEYNKLGDMLND